MTIQPLLVARADMLAEIRSLASPLTIPADLDPLVEQVGGRRLVCVGEASHRTHESCSWRAALTRRLIEEHGFTWIGVEGDWPDCWRINRWVRGLAAQELDARRGLSTFERWPTWRWANRDVADFFDCSATRSSGDTSWLDPGRLGQGLRRGVPGPTSMPRLLSVG